MPRDLFSKRILREHRPIVDRVHVPGVLFIIAILSASCKDKADYSAQTGSATYEQPVAAEISSWELQNKIHVSDEAAESLAQQISVWNAMGTGEAAGQAATAYLYELRDRKTQASSPVTELSASDLSLLSFDQFAQGLTPPEIGFLTCISTPEGGTITIDSKPKGRTNKKFALSANSTHRVVITLPKQVCRRNVIVRRDERQQISCPPVP